MTPTGRATGVELFGDRVERAWLPYDHGFATRALLRALPARVRRDPRDRALAAAARGSARARACRCSSPTRGSRSAPRGATRAFRALTRWALANLAGIAAQSQRRCRSASRRWARAQPAVTGNIKFDLDVPAGDDRARARVSARASAPRGACASRQHARRRGGAAARRVRRRVAAARGAARASCRAIRSASTRSPRSPRRAASRSRGAAPRAAWRRERARGRRRLDGRDARLLRGGRRGGDGREPARLRQPEPDRGLRGRQARDRGAVDLQLRGGLEERDRRGRRGARARCARRDGGGARACCGTTRRAATRWASAALRVRAREPRRGRRAWCDWLDADGSAAAERRG